MTNEVNMSLEEFLQRERAASLMAEQLATLRAENERLRDRMTRARHILTNGNPTPECNWGLLDV